MDKDNSSSASNTKNVNANDDYRYISLSNPRRAGAFLTKLNK